MDNNNQEKTEQPEKAQHYRVAEEPENSPIIENQEDEIENIKYVGFNMLVQIILLLAIVGNFWGTIKDPLQAYQEFSATLAPSYDYLKEYSYTIIHNEVNGWLICYMSLRRAIVCGILALMLLKSSRKATISFFVFTLVDAFIVYAFGLYTLGESLLVALMLCGVMRLVLMLRKNGVSAWKVLMAKPTQDTQASNLE